MPSSRPPWAAKAARRSAAWRSRTVVYAALPSVSSSRVEPSMSENRKVSVAAEAGARAAISAALSRPVGLERAHQCRVGVGDLAQASRDAAQDRQGQGRLLEQDLLEVPRREREAARRGSPPRRSRCGACRSSTDSSPKNSPGAEPRDDLAVADDPDPARDDDEEARADLALARDDVARREVDRRSPARRGSRAPRRRCP